MEKLVFGAFLTNDVNMTSQMGSGTEIWHGSREWFYVDKWRGGQVGAMAERALM